MEEQARAERITGLIHEWQRRLRLVDWDIRYSPEPPDADCTANNDSWGLKQIAIVRIHDDVQEGEEERHVVHELLHIALRYIGLSWQNDARRFFPPPLFESCHGLSNDEEEIAIERLTWALTGSPYVSPPTDGELYVRTFVPAGERVSKRESESSPVEVLSSPPPASTGGLT